MFRKLFRFREQTVVTQATANQVRSMAEFASRYPEHVQLLIDIVASERKEDALPPGLWHISAERR